MSSQWRKKAVIVRIAAPHTPQDTKAPCPGFVVGAGDDIDWVVEAESGINSLVKWQCKGKLHTTGIG